VLPSGTTPTTHILKPAIGRLPNGMDLTDSIENEHFCLRLLTGSDEPQRDRADFLKAAILFWIIGATDGHAKNFTIALMPGGRFRMTPLYDVLTVQPSLDAGALQIKEMTLAMRVGKGRHYWVADIHGRHFVKTALAAGFSREQVAGVFEDIRGRAERAFDEALAEMPPGFPEGLAASVRRGFEQRVMRLVAGNGG
jgi:serine/threonine-protein kinase HipA